MSNVFLLVVKGNLRHRVDLLGAEAAEESLTEAQRKLREAAQKQWKCRSKEDAQPERPTWANGAFVYLKPEHADGIRVALDAHGVRLQSKHVLVSEELFAIVKSALDARPAGPGREAFLKQRAGVISERSIVPLSSASADGLQESAKLTGLDVSDELDAAGITDLGKQAELQHIGKSQVAHIDYRNDSKNVYRLELRSDASSVLGVKKAASDLSDCEMQLRVLRDDVLFHKFNCSPPEMPDRANGACVYLARDHAAEAIDAIQLRGIFLDSTHILVSHKYKSLIDEVLQRCKADWETSVVFPLPASGHMEINSAEQLGSAGVDHSRRRKNVPLLQLSADLMEQTDIDFDLLEFLCAPVSVQQMYLESDEMWVRAWEHVCKENDWLTMKDDTKGGPCPWCLQCKKWVDIRHLVSKGCRRNVSAQGLTVGPLLAAILAAEERKVDPGRPSRSLGPASVDSLEQQHGHQASRVPPRPPPPPPPPPPPRAASGFQRAECPPRQNWGRGDVAHTQVMWGGNWANPSGMRMQPYMPVPMGSGDMHAASWAFCWQTDLSTTDGPTASYASWPPWGQTDVSTTEGPTAGYVSWPFCGQADVSTTEGLTASYAPSACSTTRSSENMHLRTDHFLYNVRHDEPYDPGAFGGYPSLPAPPGPSERAS